jgi:tetratricopeptide (TPR) repeat protein
VPEIARSLMEDAERARDAGRTDDAIAAYKKVIDAAPQLASAYADLAALYYASGKVDEAYRVLVRGVAKAPDDRTLLANAATAAQQLGKSSEALGYIDRALEKNKRDAALFASRATILRSLNRQDEALAALQQAAALAPDDARIHFSLGNQLYALGRKPEAIDAYRKAVELDKNLLRAQYNLGALLFEEGKFDEALSAYNMALEPIKQSLSKREKVDPIHSRAFANVGAIYLRQQKYDAAVGAYGTALAIDPKNADAHYNLGFIFYTRKQYDAAVPEYRAALALTPDLPLAYVHLAEIARQKRDYDTAIRTIREGLPHLDAETKPLAMRTLGLAQYAKGDRAGARESLAQATDVTSRVVLARLLRAEKRLADAQAALDAAPKNNNAVLLEAALIARDANDLARERAALEPIATANPLLHREYLRVLLQQSAYDDALQHLDAFPDLAPQKRVLQALKDAGAGRRDDAIKQLDAVTDPILRGDLGLLLFAAGRDAEARPHLAAAHAADPAWTDVTVALAELSEPEQAIELLRNVDAGKALLARSQAAVNFTRGVSELKAGNTPEARALFVRALPNLPPQAEAAAKANIAAIDAAARPVAEEQPRVVDADAPRRTAIVYLPDAPVENDKRLAEAMSGVLPGMQTEFFRRAEDARSFFAANRARVGVVVSLPDFVSELGGELVPRFQFVRNGSTSYRRVVAVAASNRATPKTLSTAIPDAAVEKNFASVVRTPDDMTAAANALYGKTDAAIVSEANPLLLRGLRVLQNAGSDPLPVIALAPMLAEDRTALESALRAMAAHPPLFTSLVSLEKPRPQPKAIEIATVPPSALRTPPERPQNVALRVKVEIPRVEIAEDLLGTP